MNDKIRDEFSLPQIKTKGFGAILVFGFLLFMISTSIAQSDNNILENQKIHSDRCDVERIGLFLKLLSSENSIERLLALKVLEFYAINKQFPIEFIPVLVCLYDKDKNFDVVQSSAKILAILAKTDTSFYKMISPRVTIIIPNDLFKHATYEIERIASFLRRDGFTVDIEDTVKSTGIKFANANYLSILSFHSNDKNDAERIKSILSKLNLESHLLSFDPFLVPRVFRPRYYTLEAQSIVAFLKK